MPSIVDPADGELHRLDSRVRELRDRIALAPDRRTRRALRRQLRAERLRAAGRIAGRRWRNRWVPW